MKKLVNGALVDLNDDELTNFSSYTLDPDAEMVALSKRNRLLSDTDWMALSDNSMTTEMASYRQALRDITEQAGFPYTVKWPIKP